MMRKFALTLVCAGLLTGNFACAPKPAETPAQPPPPAAVADKPTAFPPGADAAPIGKPVKQADGLEITDIVAGTGVLPKEGQTVYVQYVGKLKDGTVFDTSKNREAFSFVLGGGQVIKGWDEGIRGVKIGGVRHLVIPPALAYGKQGQPPTIPPDTALYFDIQLVGVM